MIDHSAEFRRCLIECDIPAVRKLWGFLAPHLSQPKTEHEALTTLHMARTQMDSIPLKLRAYSHRWLLDQGYPSQLPDELKPRAEQICPKIVDAVGISVNTRSLEFEPIVALVRAAMEDAVNDAYSNRIRPSVERIKEMMRAARAKVIKKVLG